MPRVLLAALLLILLGLGLTLTDRQPRHHPMHQAEILTAGGVPVRAVRAGRGDTTLVLLHGYGEHLLTWRSVFDPLSSRYQVVALDLPGFGGSGKPDTAYTLPAMAERVRQFIATWTTPPVILVGHSMGGAIAAEVALAAPDLVQGLILIAPAGLDVGLAPITDGPTPGRARAIGVWEATRAFITPLHDPGWLRESDSLSRYDPALDPAFRRSTGRVLEEFDFRGIGPRFADIRQPTLVVWGLDDPVIPADLADSLAGLIPCHHLVTLARTLHRPQVERPDTVVTVIRRFLEAPTCDPAR
jgi:pimeloyl-ACP methyl ester carboxylesterase